MSRPVRLHALVALAALLIPLAANAVDPVYQNWRGIAVGGTDVVAYFSDGRPVAGRSEFSLDWNGTTWRFASAENRERFRAEPERFAPQYGGYCAWAVGHGYTASSDPDAWSIVDGRLYLNYSVEVRAMWEPEKAQWIERANEEWPKLRDAR